MLGQINNSADYLAKAAINNGGAVSGANANKAAADKYADNNIFFEDQTNISNEAINLYEKEQDIQKFTNLVMDSFDEAELNAEIVNLLGNGAYSVSDDELAESLFQDDELMNTLLEA